MPRRRPEGPRAARVCCRAAMLQRFKGRVAVTSFAGFALAIPAVTRSVTSSVAPADIGTASGAFNTMRQLGGAFGVAIAGAVFAATGSYRTPVAFSRGFAAAYGVAAGLALVGAATGTVLPRRRNRTSPAAVQEPGTPSGTLRVSSAAK